MASSPDRLYVCKNTFMFEEDGSLEVVKQGAIVRAGHPVMVGREGMFTPIRVDYEVVSAPTKQPTVRPSPARR